MHNGNSPTALRRSSRVPTALPIQVTSLAGTYFSDVCKTLVVNAHGCAVLSPVKFDAGIPLRFKNRDGRETTAKVVSCQPAGPDNLIWKLGAKLDRPSQQGRPRDYSTCGHMPAARLRSPELETGSEARPPRKFLGLERFSSRLGSTERATLSKATTDYFAHNHTDGPQGNQSGEPSPRGHARVSGAAIRNTSEENDRGINWPTPSPSR